MKAIREQFSEGRHIGCLFHWKQTNRRQLTDELRLPEDIVHFMIGDEGCLEILTMMPVEEIETKGIPFCQSLIAAYLETREDDVSYTRQMAAYWTYFVKTWLKLYDPDMWNISKVLDDPDIIDFLVNRTNNPIERFNRAMNDKFPKAHPSMVEFVQAIKEESVRYVNLLRWIKAGRATPPEHQPFTLYIIPDAYHTFVPPRR